MLEVIDTFKTPDTIDDLGVGSIRDNLSDLMFPGTSVLHTRLRYVLFVPWLLQLAADHPNPQNQFRNLQLALTDSLKAGADGDFDGVGIIGARAGNSIKRLPSDIYWSALGSWSIRRRDLSSASYFEFQRAVRHQASRSPHSDDPESRLPLVGNGLDPGLPPRPAQLQDANTSTLRQPQNVLRFTLTRDEADYLSDRIVQSHGDSLLAWLILNQADTLDDAEYVWELADLGRAPSLLRRLVAHAHRFAIASEGASLIYNLLLAEAAGDEQRIAEYDTATTTWKDEQPILRDWDLDDFWTTVRAGSRRVDQARPFLTQWVGVAGNPIGHEARRLIRNRELAVKKSRARLSDTNRERLDSWTGASGVGRPAFRWNVVRSHLHDLYAARDVP